MCGVYLFSFSVFGILPEKYPTFVMAANSRKSVKNVQFNEEEECTVQ